MAQNVIEIKNLHKNYDDVHAVRGINLQIKQGEMFGLVGPDGAGKTSTIRILCGLTRPAQGSAHLLGKDITADTKEIQEQIGYLSQKFSLYGDLSIDENIEFFADIHNVKDYKQRAEELLEFTRLSKFHKRLADKLSGGMKQKLALACSLIHSPKILFLDEPTTGVDPVSRRDFWKILSKLTKEGITILMTTPYLDEAERCHRIALMNDGELIAVDTPHKVKESIDKSVVEIISTDIRKTYYLIRENLGFEVQMFGDRANVMVNSMDADMPKIEKLLKENGIEIKNERQVTPSLESVFIHLIEKTE